MVGYKQVSLHFGAADDKTINSVRYMDYCVLRGLRTSMPDGTIYSRHLRLNYFSYQDANNSRQLAVIDNAAGG